MQFLLQLFDVNDTTSRPMLHQLQSTGWNRKQTCFDAAVAKSSAYGLVVLGSYLGTSSF